MRNKLHILRTRTLALLVFSVLQLTALSSVLGEEEQIAMPINSSGDTELAITLSAVWPTYEYKYGEPIYLAVCWYDLRGPSNDRRYRIKDHQNDWYIDGSYIETTFTSGSWGCNSITYTDVLDVGNHSWTVRAGGRGYTDAFGWTNYRWTTFGPNPLIITLNSPPVAICQDVTVEAGPGCEADASIDNGSYDPDGDPITITQNPPGPYPLGETEVTLTVTDYSDASDTCTATVEVVDGSEPVITSVTPASQVVPVGSPANFTVVATDNCSCAETVWQFDVDNPLPEEFADCHDSMSHTYASPGIYDVGVVAVDDAGNMSDPAQVYVVVYDPTAGFVTGGGWIDSPEGAYMLRTATITNGSFETGDYTGWTLWEGGAGTDPSWGTWGIAQDGQVANYGDLLFDYFDGVWNQVLTPGTPITFEASDGDYVAFNLQLGPQTHQMYQDITIPDDWDISILSWDMKYNNHDGYFSPDDQYIAVHIRDTSDNILETLHKTTQGVDPLVLPMTSFSKDISAYAGTTVRLDVQVVANLFFFDALAFDNFAVDCLPAGKANFGFVSKYKKGADTPTGQTEFQFHAGDLNFHSSSYEWLVVTGSNYARFKGTGTINGSGEYKFMLWAGDSEPDTFRIKIWTEPELDLEIIEYDNGMDQAIGGGGIIVHTSKK